MTAEWIEYTGSEEQIAELLDTNNSFIIPTDKFIFNYEYFDGNTDLRDFFSNRAIKSYLICNPHPLAGMARQQLLTGQPVWVNRPHSFNDQERVIYVTTTPDWNISGAEYSFTEFKE